MGSFGAIRRLAPDALRVGGADRGAGPSSGRCLPLPRFEPAALRLAGRIVARVPRPGEKRRHGIRGGQVAGEALDDADPDGGFDPESPVYVNVPLFPQLAPERGCPLYWTA